MVRYILSFSAKSTSYCRKCPIFSRSICHHVFCFHIHSYFERIKLTSFFVGPSPTVTFRWNRISVKERRPDCCRLGMGSTFASPDELWPTYYTYESRPCKVNSEATPKSRPRPDAGPVSAQRRSASAPPGGSIRRRLRRGDPRSRDLPREHKHDRSEKGDS
jgi:hypothetical protein